MHNYFGVYIKYFLSTVLQKFPCGKCVNNFSVRFFFFFFFFNVLTDVTGCVALSTWGVVRNEIDVDRVVSSQQTLFQNSITFCLCFFFLWHELKIGLSI